MMMSSRRLSTWILLRDRRRAAIHEAGHFTIGRHLATAAIKAPEYAISDARSAR
jgi:hypothetical protein